MELVTPACLPRRPFFYLRHGQTDWNAAGRIQGHTDIPLNATGFVQAEHAAQQLAGLGVNRIITSPLKRAFATAMVLQRHLGVGVQLTPLLAEWHFGSHEGRLRAEVLATAGLGPTASFLEVLPADAETAAQVQNRALRAVQQALADPTAVPVLVGHGALLRVLAAALTPLQHSRFGNAQPYLLQPEPHGSQWQLNVVGTPTPASGCTLVGEPLRQVA